MLLYLVEESGLNSLRDLIGVEDPDLVSWRNSIGDRKVPKYQD
jgi:hypothetical protein